jgi:hypothetical protein
MWLLVKPEKYSTQHIHFMDPIKNNVLENSMFSRIIYSTDYFSTHGLFLNSSERNTQIEHSLLCAFSSPKAKQYNLQKVDGLGIIKISGIWENEVNYGLAFKFIKY